MARDPESERLREDRDRERNWKRWGPYLSERQWGTVREDYSPDGSCWTYFPHDHARSRAYRWGEDGLLGITDRQCRLCFALALWNEADPILKERLFGLVPAEGNHGEDVKEVYFYEDATPTSSYLRSSYRYPQREFPYARLVAGNRRRTRDEPELELEDTGVFDGGRWFEVIAEYAKAAPEDILVRITIRNRGPEPAPLHVLPTLWLRNTWSWGCEHEGCDPKPVIERAGPAAVVATQVTLGRFRLVLDIPEGGPPPPLLFTENETNVRRLFGAAAGPSRVKDAFHEQVIGGGAGTGDAEGPGTKAAFHLRLGLPALGETVLRLRLVPEADAPASPFADFDEVFARRRHEADLFYAARIPPALDPEERRLARTAYAGLLFTKQFYHYAVHDWLEGDPGQPPPPPSRKHGRNHDWRHLFNRDVLSVPDKWEFPWYAAWDLAFHMLPMARIDPEFAKEQLVLLLREWYLHPNGQMPAYEFAFGDVNPPVHAWACWRVYKLTAPRGQRDRRFLERTFHKLLINFTWWVNRKDVAGRHVFSGGFLGLDNIGIFDRSRPLPTGGHLEQADGTAWMAFYCATMLAMALELGKQNPAYADVASKFFEHFVAIADAMNSLGGSGLWDELDGFYYDEIHVPGLSLPLRIRSMVGLVPLFTAEVLDEEAIAHLPAFRKRMEWFLENRRDLGSQISYMTEDARKEHLLLAIPSRERLVRVLRIMLDEEEFLSPFGIRSLSRFHLRSPFFLRVAGEEHRVAYEPGEARSALFGGNSNWRGPIWFPVNWLIIEVLERYHYFYGDELKVECPTGSGRLMNLRDVSRELARRLCRIFLPEPDGTRPFRGRDHPFARDPGWSSAIHFHEYFHGDTGQGLGASHQTGWTSLVTRCLEALARERSS